MPQPFANVPKDIMSESAWRMTPEEYLGTRSECRKVPSTPISCYVTMRDGCRIAVDAYLPDGDADAGPFPALLFFTPYYRRFRLAEGSQTDPNPNTGQFRDFFVSRGYAVVVVDVRGTGASFGVRDGFRSPMERLDSAEVANWVVAQRWSDGSLGATGISYLGAAADFLASTGHPAVKAIAPLFSVWDTYLDNYFPGGLQIRSLTHHYDRMMLGLDQDQRDILKDFGYFSNPDFCGPQPVDEDGDGVLLARAVREHMQNFRQTEFMADLRYREEALPYDPFYSSAQISPYHYCEGVRPEVAILSVSGWLDGAGYANGAIARFLTLDRNPRHLLLGPWDHGARVEVSPWRRSDQPGPTLLAELLRFFDTYLMTLETGLEAEAPVHYYCVHEERWRSAQAWPPSDATLTLFPDAQGALDRRPGNGTCRYSVDPTIGTGRETRYERIAGLDSRNYYFDWQGRTDRMLNWETAELGEGLTIAGHPILTLDMALDSPDAALFAYLTEVEPDGSERYITEGLLRALHRAEAAPPGNQKVDWPWRPFRRQTAKPWVPERFEPVRLPLLPTAWQVQAGSRLRLSLSGADADHFDKIPHGRAPEFRIRVADSSLRLPVIRPPTSRNAAQTDENPARKW